MPSLLDKLKPSNNKGESDSNDKEQEPTYSIQPHPAKTNDPRDLEPPQTGGGLNTNPELRALNNPGPVIPSQEMVNSLEQPASRDELRARAADLN